MKFEVPQRQKLASVRAPLSLFAPVSSTVSCVPPLTRNLAPADPSPTPSGGGQAFQRQLPPAFLCSGQPSAMRFRKRAVPKTGFYGTEGTLGAQNSLLWYATHFQKHSVRKNRLLRYGRDIRCAKQPSLVRDAFSEARRTAPAAPDASSVRETASARRRANMKRG